VKPAAVFSRRRLGSILLLLLVGILLAVARMPALFAWQSFLADAPALRGLTLTGLEGTVWAGRAAQLRYGRLEAGPLEWDLSVLPLLWGRTSAQLRLELHGGRVTGEVALSGDALELEDLRLRLPLSLFAPLIYGSPFVPDGELDGTVAEALMAPGEACRLAGRLVWISPGVAGIENLGLGDIQLELEPEAQGTRGVLRDRGGALGIDGTLSIDAACRYRLDVRLTPRGEISDPLRRMLGFAGRADAQGRYRLQRQGQLPVR